jgi:hypothetical protein
LDEIASGTLEHRLDKLRSFIHAEIPSLAILLHPNQGPCLGTAINRYVGFVAAVKKSWSSQKIAHVGHGYDARLRAVCDVE